MEAQAPLCPLCASKENHFFCERSDSAGKGRAYYQCPVCTLIFLCPEKRLTAPEEKKHYDFHRNHPKDLEYLNFLRRLAQPLSLKLKPEDEGLDFGCGPGPAMSFLFREKGFKMENYDPLYFPDPVLLTRTYNFITCSEVIEHFFNPGREFLRLAGLLKKGGFLGVMTCLLEDEASFKTWYYPQDPTHVCFYQKKTLEWISKKHGWALEFPQANTAIFTS